MSELKYLTTESIWIFGTERPAVALQLSHLLPRSLVRLHLIDYWGNSDPAELYHEFPNRRIPLVPYTQVFGILRDGVPIRLSELRGVTFTSNCSDSNPQSRFSIIFQGERNETKITEDSMHLVKRAEGGNKVPAGFARGYGLGL